MPEPRKDERNRLNLPKDLLQAIEERAKRLNLSKLDALRELLAREDRNDILIAKVEAQEIALEAICSETKRLACSLQAGESKASTRQEMVLAEIRGLRDAPVKATWVASPRLSEATIVRPTKHSKSDRIMWGTTIALLALTLSYYIGFYGELT